jgi:hypothetical protein
MAQIDEEIRQALRRFILDTVGTSAVLAKVKSVDDAECSCVLTDDDGIDLNDVRLRPVLDGKEGITVFPKVGTWCFAIRIESDDDWLALCFGEVDKFRLKVGDSTIEVTNAGIVFNGGGFGGLVKLLPLVSKLNNLENSVNGLKNIFSAWVPVPSDGGAALKTAIGTWANTTLSTTTSNDLKNDKIKH